jgi:predicted dehydrogenase
MSGLGIGLIGTGYMGKSHALAWNAVAPVFGDVARPRLAMLAEVDEALASRRAGELGFAASTGDWRRLVEDPSVDVVSITTPNAFHAPMAIAALEAGKHVWCEKPMAPTLADSRLMHAAWRASGKVAVLGYNYIQNPAMRLIARLAADGTIGTVNQVRVEMDEDFMDPLSLLRPILGDVVQVFGDMSRPYADRPDAKGGRRPVETYDAATALIRTAGGVSGMIAVNRSAWGRKGRIQLQLFGDRGTIAFDQERFNEVQLFTRDGPAETQGFRTVLTGPLHPPYDRFMPAPGHGLGFNDLKTIECRELIRAIEGQPATILDFADGLAIERTVHAIAGSFEAGRWMEVG